MERKEKNNHDGHRQRIIKKLDESELLEHELLEVLLFYVFKRRNTNDIAHALLAEFGSLKNILTAPKERLEKVEGIGTQSAQFLWMIGKCAAAFKKDVLASEMGVWGKYDVDAFAKAIRGSYIGLRTEVLDFYLLDKQGNVFKRRRFYGEKTRVKLEPFLFSQTLVENEPSGVIIVHNHPGGSLTPSTEDDEATRLCQVICSANNVLLCDHLIVTDGGMYSYYQVGEMQRISKEYAVRKLTAELRGKEEKYVDEEVGLPNVFQKNFDNFSIKKEGDRYVVEE